MPKTRRRSAPGALSQNEYEKIAEFRYQLVRFLRRRKDAAREEGLQGQQYELLLAVAGLPDDKEPTIKEVAAQLRLEHHTVVELANRLEKRGYLMRIGSQLDGRAVLLKLTRPGRTALNRIARFSFSQLSDEAPALIRSLRRILQS